VRPEFDARRLLKRHSIRPLKRLGQHFMVDPRALKQVLAAAELGGTETVLEVGAGLGSLTRALAIEARRVIAVELDPRLLPPLREVLQGLSSVEIVIGDILDMDLKSTVRRTLPGRGEHPLQHHLDPDPPLPRINDCPPAFGTDCAARSGGTGGRRSGPDESAGSRRSGVWEPYDSGPGPGQGLLSSTPSRFCSAAG